MTWILVVLLNNGSPIVVQVNGDCERIAQEMRAALTVPLPKLGASPLSTAPPARGMVLKHTCIKADA